MAAALELASAGKLCAQTAWIPTQSTPADATQREAAFGYQGEPYVNADIFYDEQPEQGPFAEFFGDDSEVYEQWPMCAPMTGLADDWTWQLLPDGLIYKSYLAGVKEPRMSGVFFHEKDRGWLLDVTLGGRVGIARFGTTNDVEPEGWELDVEGAAFPRLDLDPNWDMVSTDFRFGIPLTYGRGKLRTKFGYYHLSSHLGDEEIISLGSASTRINYARDSIVLGVSYYPNPSLRLYGETAWAFYSDGGSEPWEFQFGLDYSPIGWTGIRGAPFFAINGHLRQEVNYGGNLVVQTGWQWRGYTSHLFRVGFHYFNGQSNQYQFFDTSEQQVGLGIWYDY